MPTRVLKGECVVEGRAESEALVADADLAISLIEPATGIVKQPGHPLFGQSIAGKVLIFPSGGGSSSGSYRLLDLADQGTAPAAIVNTQANAVVTAGAVLGNIPLVHRVSPDPVRSIRSGDRVEVDASAGTVTVLSGVSP